MALPDWITTGTQTPAAAQVAHRYARHARRVPSVASSFLQVARRELLAEESASRPGFLQSIDPRAKLISAMIVIVCASLISNIPSLTVCLLVAWIIMLVSRVRATHIMRVTFPPLAFSVVIVLPTILNIVVPGKPLFVLADLGIGRNIWGLTVPQAISVTDAGVASASRFLLRTSACVAWASMLVLTTRLTALLSSLRSLGIPSVFNLTLLMMYRYVFALVRHAEDLQLAKESRTISTERTLQGDRSVAARIGHLFQTSRRLADQVYFAMVARGFSGSARRLDQSAPRRRDIVVVGAAILAGMALVAIDRMAGG